VGKYKGNRGIKTTPEGREAMPLAPKCKVCQLVHFDEETFIQLHKYVLEECMAQSAVLVWLNKRIEVLNANLDKDKQMPLFNAMNLSNHFKKHVSSADSLACEVKKKIMDKTEMRNTSFTTREQLIADSVAEMPMEDLDDFSKLEEVVRSVGNYLQEFNKQMREQDRPPSLIQIESYNKMAGEYVRMSKDIIGLRSSDRIAGAAIQYALKQIVNEVAVRLNDSVKNAVGMLEKELPKSNLPEEIGRLIMGKVGEGLQQAIPEIRDRVKKEYKIK
jgi:hypothetical protein